MYVKILIECTINLLKVVSLPKLKNTINNLKMKKEKIPVVIVIERIIHLAKY